MALRANAACPDVCAPSATCVDEAARILSRDYERVLATSQAIEGVDHAAIAAGLAAALAPRPGQPGQARSDETPASGLYFISPEGVSRVVPGQPADELLAHYMSNGASYFSQALQRVTRGDACNRFRSKPHSTASPGDKLEGFVTYPYLDMFGTGLVETYCQPIDVAHGRGSALANTTIGVLCTDIHHPESEVIGGLVEASAALDLTVVRIWEPADAGNRQADGRGRWQRTLRVTPCDEMPFRCPPQLKTFEDWSRLRLFATVYYNTTLSNRQSLRPGGVFVEREGGGDRDGDGELDGIAEDAKFAVAVYRGADYWDVAIGRLRQSTRRDFAALGLSGGCILAAIAILALGYRRKMRRREAYLARGLAYGLLRIGALDNIIGANDRAESVLNVRLPRLGIYGAGGMPRNTFSGFIDYLHCVVIPIAGALNQRCVVNYDQIRRRSIDGLTTDFYAYLKSRVWVRVSTRIVVLPDKQEDLFYALDTHICDGHAAFLRTLHG